MNLTEQGLRMLAASPIADPARGHAHFWERALSRRHFMVASGLAGGAVITSSAWMPVVAEAASGSLPTPIPIPYGTMVGGKLFHFLPPADNLDQSSIYDFMGVTGVAELSGPGAGTDGDNFGSDNRFMQGVYRGADGKRHHGTFAFI